MNDYFGISINKCAPLINRKRQIISREIPSNAKKTIKLKGLTIFGPSANFGLGEEDQFETSK